MSPHAACVAAGLLSVAPSARAAQRQTIKHYLPANARAYPLGRLTNNLQLNFTIALPLQNTGSLSNFLQQLYDPTSTNYHRYITPVEFARRFSPMQQDYHALIDFAHAHGLAVLGTHPNRTLLDLGGTVADVERAFHVTMQTYRHPTEPRNFQAPDLDPSGDFPVRVLSVAGLDDFILPRPMKPNVRFTKDVPIPSLSQRNDFR